jgi:type VI secretion system protein ImpC
MKEESPGGTFRVEAGVRPASTTGEFSDRPFFVALLGDFSGRSARGKVGDSSDVSGRAPLQIDRDDLDAVMARLGLNMKIALPNGAESIELSFAELEDFHPDRLFDQLALFGALKGKRNEIADPAGFAKFKERLKQETAAQSEQSANDSPPPVDGNLLNQILDDSSTQAASAAVADGGLQEFVRRAVAPHEVPRADPTQAELLAQLDEQIASRMRWVLHRAEFQALEAVWRGVSFLCRRVETSPTLKLFLIDISKEELRRDQSPDVPIEKSGLYRLLVESSVGTPGATPWSLLVGCYSFGPQMDDLKLLARVGAIASLANAPWLSAAESAVVGCPSFDAAPDPNQWDEPDREGWDAIRLLPYASRLGLAVPRFLLRLPYGSETDECEQLAFEEIAGDDHLHEEYLWGNPALLCALLVTRAYAARGSGVRPGGNLEIDKLPLHLRKTAGDTIAQPCAEALLTERALTRMSDRGLMVLASLKDRDAVRLLRFQSVSDPPTSLEGPWE